jgi:hypothetical protein
MDLPFNIFITSLIFTVILLIIINIVLIDYEITNKYQLWLFIYLYVISLFSINIHKKIVLYENSCDNPNVVHEVFKELQDNRETVKKMSEPVTPIIQGNSEIDIDIIPTVFTNK